jgi:hypothetical protein
MGIIMANKPEFVKLSKDELKLDGWAILSKNCFRILLSKFEIIVQPVHMSTFYY